MTNEEKVVKSMILMKQDEYFALSEDRKTVTPENLGGLIEYPALFRAMQDDRELRPALSPAMSSGRAMNDYITCSATEFGERYTVADGPVNPKTGKPYGTDSKAYLEWASKQDKTPVPSSEYAMFANMAKAYEAHSAISALSGYACIPNAVFRAVLAGVDCCVKVDKLYVSDGAVIAVDVKTTSDLCSFARSSDSLHYREQQALISLVLSENGIQDPQVIIAAIEKGPVPRCGVFSVKGIDEVEESVYRVLEDYGRSMASGSYRTNFEALMAL